MSINHLSFNNLSTNLTCCTDQGYIVYTLNPQLEKRRFMELNGSVGLAKIFNNTNMILLVGGCTKPFKSKDTFILYDQKTETTAIEIDMKEPIKNILITKSHIIVVLERKVLIFGWDGTLTDTKLTYSNPNGLCAVNATLNIIVTLGTKKGDIAIWEYAHDNYKTIDAHLTNIEALTISNDGLLVATSSETGTLIRVYNTITKLLKYEFRRGTTGITIYDLAFNNSSSLLTCCSSHGTVHVFDLPNDEMNKNTHSMFSGYANYLPGWFSSQWSFKQLRIGNTSKAICTFDDNNDIHVVTYDGSYFKIVCGNNEYSTFTQGNLHINNK